MTDNYDEAYEELVHHSNDAHGASGRYSDYCPKCDELHTLLANARKGR